MDRAGAIIVTAGLVLAAGCRVDRAPMNASHSQRVAEIDRMFDAEIAESERRWNELGAQILGQRRYLVEVDKDGKPTHWVVNNFIEAWDACQAVRDTMAAETLREKCEADVRKNYWGTVGRRYFKADFRSLFQEQSIHPEIDIEVLAAKSHNDRLETEMKSQIAEIERYKAEFRATMNGYRVHRLQMSAQQRDQEIEAADRRRRAIWAAALQGLGEGMQNASQTSSASGTSSTYAPSAYAVTPATATGCTSDFSCGIGNTCVKKFYNSTGVCMRAANAHGGPSYDLPDLNSVGPNMPNANSCTSVGSSCPAGFRCDYSSGRCVR